MRFISVLSVIFILVCTLSITNLDIFRLGYIFAHSTGCELVYKPISGQYQYENVFRKFLFY